MIHSFADKATAQFARLERVRAFAGFERVALRKLAMLEVVAVIEDMRVPPGNRLEALCGDRAGFWSIRIYDQWRLVFRWELDGTHAVEICDYH